MASSLGAAAVEIIAETDEFDDELRRSLEQSANEASALVSRNLRSIRADAEETGRRLGNALGDGAQDAARSIERLGQLAASADAALHNMDADALTTIARQAGNSANEMEALARAAEEGRGAFANLNAAQIGTIAREARQAAEEMRRLQSESSDAVNTINRFSDADSVRRLAEEMRQAQRETQRLGRTSLQNLRRDISSTSRALFLGFRGGAEDARDALDSIDNANFRKIVLKAIVAAQGVKRAFQRATKDIDFSRIGNGLKTLVSAGAGVAFLAARMATLAATAAQVVGVLAPGLQIIAGLPAAALLAAGAIATLKIGLSGMGDAFKAAVGGDQKAFEESIKNLAPSAQSVAKEVNKLAPAFKRLKQSVQGALFKPLQGEITAVAKNLAGPLRTGMTATASQFGRLGASVTAFGKSASAVTLVQGLFSRLKTEIAGVKSDTVTGLFKAISAFVSQTLPGFGGLGAAIDRTLQRLTNFLNKAVAGGKAFQWLETGKAAIAQIGHLLADLGATALNVFNSIRAAGGGNLTAFQNLAAGLREFTGSAEGSSQITTVFKAINAVAAQTLPVIKALIGGLASLAPTVQQLALQVGPILTSAIEGIVPALQGVGDGLVPVFQQLGEAVDILAQGGGLTAFGKAVGDLLAALAPLLPTIATLINSGLNVLGPALSALAPVISGIASALDAIANSPLGPFLGVLAAQFLLVFAVTGKVGLAFRSLGPTLRLTGTLLRLAGQAVIFLGRALITALIANPVVAAILAIIAVLVIAYFKVKVFRDIVNAIGSALLTAGKAILGFGKSLVEAFQAGGISGLISKIGSSLGNLGGLIGDALSGLGGVVLSGLSAGFSAVVTFFAQLPGKIVSALVTFGPQVLAAIGNGLLSVIVFLGTWYIKFITFFITLPFKIAGFLLQVGPTILRAIATGLGAVLLFLANFVIQVLAFFITLPFRILGALLSLALLIKQPFLNGVTAVVNFLTTAIPAILAFFAALPGRILAFLVSLPGRLAAAASAAWNAFKTATITAVTAIVAFARAAPGRILSGLQRLGSLLSSLASRAWNAFKSATSRGISAAIAFIRSLPGKAVAALSSFNARMAQLGRDVMQGFINGVKALAGNLISAVTGPIGDAIGKAKSLLGINSPSKVFKSIGASIGEGFVKGLQGSTSKIDSTITSLIDRVRKAFGSKNLKIRDRIVEFLRDSNKDLQKLATKRDALADKIKAATDKAAEVASSAAAFASLSSVGQELGQIPEDQIPRTEAALKKAAALADAAAEAEARRNDPKLLVQGLAQRLKVIQKFQADVNKLAARGLNKDLIAQVIGLGPDQGAGLAAGLANATADQIKDLNRTQAAIAKATKSLGNDSADILFDSGKQAGKGFLEGLKSQQAEIVKLMTTLAKAVAATVKKTLKISSPSRVFAGLGSNTLEGFVDGLERVAPQVEKALQRAVDARGLDFPDLSAAAADNAIRAQKFADLAATRSPASSTAGSPVPTSQSAGSSSDRSSSSGPRTITNTTINAPVNVTMPNADPALVGRRVSEAIAARVTR